MGPSSNAALIRYALKHGLVGQTARQEMRDLGQ
jgi:hypothetical protein